LTPPAERRITFS